MNEEKTLRGLKKVRGLLNWFTVTLLVGFIISWAANSIGQQLVSMLAFLCVYGLRSLIDAFIKGYEDED